MEQIKLTITYVYFNAEPNNFRSIWTVDFVIILLKIILGLSE